MKIIFILLALFGIASCEKVEEVLQKGSLDGFFQCIESNQEKLDQKLSKHISFIDSTYEGLRNPIDAAKRWLGR